MLGKSKTSAFVVSSVGCLHSLPLRPCVSRKRLSRRRIRANPLSCDGGPILDQRLRALEGQAIAERRTALNTLLARWSALEAEASR